MGEGDEGLLVGEEVLPFSPQNYSLLSTSLTATPHHPYSRPDSRETGIQCLQGFLSSSWESRLSGIQQQAFSSHPFSLLPGPSPPLPLAPPNFLSTHFRGQPSPGQAPHSGHSLHWKSPSLKISLICPLSWLPATLSLQAKSLKPETYVFLIHLVTMWPQWHLFPKLQFPSP